MNKKQLKRRDLIVEMPSNLEDNLAFAGGWQEGENNIIMETLMSVNQTAKILCVSPRTIWTLTREGTLNCIKIGRRVLYDPTDVRTFIDRCRQNGNNQTTLLELN